MEDDAGLVLQPHAELGLAHLGRVRQIVREQVRPGFLVRQHVLVEQARQ